MIKDDFNTYNKFFDDAYFTDRYWYFRLSERFFNDKDISAIENIPIYGHSFIVVLLKLCALSLQDKGYIRIPKYIVTDHFINYLSTQIKMDLKIVSLAMDHFIRQGIVTVYDEKPSETVIFVPIVENNTGKSSIKADKQRIRDRRIQMLDYNQEEPMCLTCQPEEVILIDDIDIYGSFKNVKLSKFEYRNLEELYDKKLLDIAISELSIAKKFRNIKPKSDFEYLKRKLEG